jgi:hypothetical protein
MPVIMAAGREGHGRILEAEGREEWSGELRVEEC